MFARDSCSAVYRAHKSSFYFWILLTFLDASELCPPLFVLDEHAGTLSLSQARWRFQGTYYLVILMNTSKPSGFS